MQRRSLVPCVSCLGSLCGLGTQCSFGLRNTETQVEECSSFLECTQGPAWLYTTATQGCGAQGLAHAGALWGQRPCYRARIGMHAPVPRVRKGACGGQSVTVSRHEHCCAQCWGRNSRGTCWGSTRFLAIATGF